MDRSELAIIIPAWNEERSVGQVVLECCHFGVPILVDDGSRDATAEIAMINGAIVLKHAMNKGYDEAINSGFQRASELNFLYVVTFDADGQHHPELIRVFHENLRSGAQLVIGRRERHQRFSEGIYGKITNFLYGFSDPLCGLKGYAMSLYRDLGHFDSYCSIGTELCLYGARNGYVSIEIPIVVRERIDNPRFGGGARANLKILRSMLISFLPNTLRIFFYKNGFDKEVNSSTKCNFD